MQNQESSRHHMLGRLLLSVVCIALILAWLMQLSSSAQSELSPATPESRSELAPRTKSEQQIIEAYRKTNEAVVNITLQTASMDFFGPIYQEGSGSGVIVDAGRALIVTNSHVISSARRVAVTLANGKSYLVELIGHDPHNEISLLKVKNPPTDLVAAELGDSSTLEVGQRVLAIGNPFGLQRTLTTGIISSLGRAIRSETGRLIEDVIQTDAAINPGNSGGPLLDTAGRVVGLNTAIVSRSGESAGIGFAIPVNQIKKALPQLIKYGRVLRPRIGVIMGDTKYGVAILSVLPGSPADKAGLQGAHRVMRGGLFSDYLIDVSQADFILTVEGTEVKSKEEAINALSKIEAGKQITLVVRRGVSRRKVREIKLTPVME